MIFQETFFTIQLCLHGASSTMEARLSIFQLLCSKYHLNFIHPSQKEFINYLGSNEIIKMHNFRTGDMYGTELLLIRKR